MPEFEALDELIDEITHAGDFFMDGASIKEKVDAKYDAGELADYEWLILRRKIERL